MVRFGVGFLAIGALVCILPTSADARSRSDLRNCRYITSANAARCCAVIRPFNVDACERRARNITRGWEGAFFRGQGGPGNPGGGGGGGGGLNLNPAGHPVPGIGVGILAPNNGSPGPGPGFGPSGNPGLGGFGPPGQHGK
jgi:hypothetical protein